MDRYGDRLVAVRYRYDDEKRKRLKTVELIEEEVDWIPDAPLYLVKIAYDELDLREQIKRAGGTWNAERKSWLLRRDEVRRLHLETRINGWLEHG